jgi:hypothetical protein
MILSNEFVTQTPSAAKVRKKTYPSVSPSIWGTATFRRVSGNRGGLNGAAAGLLLYNILETIQILIYTKF